MIKVSKISPLAYKVILMPSGGLFLERFFLFYDDQKFRYEITDGAVDHSDLIVNGKVFFLEQSKSDVVISLYKSTDCLRCSSLS